MYESDFVSGRGLRRAFTRILLVLCVGIAATLGAALFSANVRTPLTAFAFHSSLVDQGAPPTLLPGASTTYTLRYRNTGARTWARGVAGQQVNLGVVEDATSKFVLAAGWPSANRVAVQTEPVVGPGAIASFTFRVKAPMTAGIFPLRLRLVADGVTWLEDEDVVTLVTVGATAGSAASKLLVTTSPTFTFGASIDRAAVVAGDSLTLTATFTSLAASTPVLGVEIYSPSG